LQGERAGAGKADHSSTHHHGVDPFDRHTANLPPAARGSKRKGGRGIKSP